MKYDIKNVITMLYRILEWRIEDKDTELYREIEVLKRILEMDLCLDDY